MPRGVQHADQKFAQRQRVAGLDQHIEIAAVGGKIIGFEQRREHRLHRRDPGADHQLRPGQPADMVPRRQMVGMGMGFQHIAQIEPEFGDARQHGAGRSRRQPRALGFEIEHRVDDRGGAACRVPDDMGGGEGGGVETGFDNGDRLGHGTLLGLYINTC